jgi:uncharacterized membrane protein YqiK
MNQAFLMAMDSAQAVATLLVVCGSLFAILIGQAVLFAKCYRKSGPETAIIRSGQGGLRAATGSGIWVVPLLHRAEEMALSVKRIDVTCFGESAVVCADHIRADAKAAFFVRVNNTREDILNVAQSLGCQRASDPTVLAELFEPKFAETIATAAGQSRFSELAEDQDAFKKQVLKLISTDVNGFVVDDLAVKHLDRTPSENCDPLNILVGQSCVITTPHSTNNHGQARHVSTEAAPLLLNVRSTDSSLTKGDLAGIVSFDPHQHTYSVEKLEQEVEK